MTILLKFTLGSGLLLVAAAGHAQSIYKCPLPHGGFQYTDMPCTGPQATVIHKATKSEVEAKRSAENHQAMVGLLRAGQVTQAQRYATDHHAEREYNAIVESLKRDAVAERQRQRQEAELAREEHERAAAMQIGLLSQQNAALQDRVNAQAEALDMGKQRTAAARSRARAAQTRARAIEQDASSPKFDPQSGKWCQQLNGTLNCW